MPRRPESDHERGVIAPLYGGCGFEVYATSARVHPIGVTPGIADLIVHAEPIHLMFYHEVKIEGYRQTLDQQTFMRSAIECNTAYVLGDIDSANAWLCWLGIAERLNETIRFRPRDRWREEVDHRHRHFDGDIAIGWTRSREWAAQIAKFGYRASTGPLKRRAAGRA